MTHKDQTPLAQIAAEKIIEMIREEKLQPGDRLQNEYDLAKRLEVGRSTVREAIKSLETRNILTIRRGAGTYLSSREGVAEDPLGIALMGKDEEIALELLEVRMILEPESAAMAAVHASKEEKAAIRRQNRRVTAMIEQGLNHTEEDSKFHQLIAKATGNRIIAKLIPIIYRSVSLTIEMTNRRLSETTILFHEQIVDAMERKALECKPKLIVGGASAYSREWDYKRMREIADKVGALLMVDMAHTAGLIAAGLLENPVKYAHIVTSTTHKTLRGPRGGIILMGKDFENPWGQTTPKGAVKMMSQILNSAVFPGIQGGPLEHVIAAKAVAFGEALEPAYKEYQTQVQKNAAAMAAAFVERGYKIVSGGTDNHLMLVDLRTKFPELTGKLAEKCLVAADITTNKNMVPFDSRSPFQTSGLRFGTPAITTRGLKEDKMDYIVGLIDRVLHDPENEANIAAVRKDVNALMADYPLFAW